ncbi:MAG: ion transporter [Tumebacillaceae bacterium]
MRVGRILYEIFILLIVLTYGIIIFADLHEHPGLTKELIQRMDWFLIVFFAIEYLVRLWFAKDQWRFIKQNGFDLLAILPLDAIFPLARLMRLARLIRLFKSSPLLWSVITSKSVTLILLFLSVFMLWSSAGFYFLEKGKNPVIQNFSDALWWAVVTTTTVGYGDIAPVTNAGRMIAVVLIVSGVALIGMFTANMANHWMDYFQPYRFDKRRHKQEVALTMEDHIKARALENVQHIEALSEEEYVKLLKMLELLRHPNK